MRVTDINLFAGGMCIGVAIMGLALGVATNVAMVTLVCGIANLIVWKVMP